MGTSIVESVIEEAMRHYGRHSSSLMHTGTKFGLNYAQWEQRILNDLREHRYGTPRCTRRRAWDVNIRIMELEQLARL